MDRYFGQGAPTWVLDFNSVNGENIVEILLAAYNGFIKAGESSTFLYN